MYVGLDTNFSGIIEIGPSLAQLASLAGPGTKWLYLVGP